MKRRSLSICPVRFFCLEFYLKATYKPSSIQYICLFIMLLFLTSLSITLGTGSIFVS